MEKDDKTALLTELLIDTEKKNLETEKKVLQELSTIRKWIEFFGIVTIISLIGGVIAVFAVISNLRY
jgi:pyruvate/oxaloacetate carboxyltransferase